MQMCVCVCVSAKRSAKASQPEFNFNYELKSKNFAFTRGPSVCRSVGECEFAHGRNDSLRTQTADCFDCQDPFKQTFAAFRTFI